MLTVTEILVANEWLSSGKAWYQMIDIQGIKALPHRYPMLLVDRVLEVSRKI